MNPHRLSLVFPTTHHLGYVPDSRGVRYVTSQVPTPLCYGKHPYRFVVDVRNTIPVERCVVLLSPTEFSVVDRTVWTRGGWGFRGDARRRGLYFLLGTGEERPTIADHLINLP